MNNYYYIFDLDGTLYDLDGVAGTTFGASRFCQDLLRDTREFIGQRLQINPPEAERMLVAIQLEFNGEISLGLERKYGIDRLEYFASTWNKPAESYLTRRASLPASLKKYKGRAALLSAAPRIWIDEVLAYLGVAEVFGDWIFSGEPDLRKPNPEVFLFVAQAMSVSPTDCISIGDQNHTDILPAKAVGMTTALLGTKQLDADYNAPNLETLLRQLSTRRIR